MSGTTGPGMWHAGMQKLPHELALLDGDGTIVAVNEAWRTFADRNHGDDPDYWVGQNYIAICERSEDDLASQQVAPDLRALLTGERDRYHHEYPCHSPDDQRWFRLDARRFRFQGRPYAVVSHTDITDEKLAELRAETRTRQLETVLDVLMHDLRNPLNVVDGHLELLAAELGDSDTVETLRQAVARITEITEATLAFADSGTLTETEHLAVDDLARTAWRSVATEAATLAVETDQRVIGDRRLLLQLFENLFRNAVEHAGPDCTVTVGHLETGFAVTDDGPGIPEAVREKALAADYSTRGAGGLGLAIVQAVVQAHGGDLTIGTTTDGGARVECTGFEVPPEPIGEAASAAGDETDDTATDRGRTGQ